MRHGQTNKKAYWLQEEKRAKERAAFFTLQRKRKARRARIDTRRAQEEKVCYWCEGAIPKHRLKHNSQQPFCGRACFVKDRHERNTLTGFYYALSKKGNEAQYRIEMETGTRPGYEKRVQHMKHYNERRRKK